LAYPGTPDYLRNPGSLTALKAELARAQDQEAEAATAARAAATGHETMRTEHAAAEPARRFITDADNRHRMLAELTLRVGMAEDDIARLEGQRDNLAGQLSAARARRRFGHGHLKTLVGENTQHLAAATSRRDEAQARLRQLAPQLNARVEESRRAALPHTGASLANLDERLAKASETARRERENWDARTRLTRELMAGIERLRLQPEPAADDEETVRIARSRDLPGKFAKLPELKKRAESIHREIARLTDDHERVVSRMRKESSQARKEIVRGAKVVATTLAKLRLTKELRERDYDYVIVDEVSAACAPEVLFSAAQYSGELAFLSACRTAAGGVDLPDEVITLAAALNYTGYRHVVATQWSVGPPVAADVTTAVYTEMITGSGFQPGRSAVALHHAVRALRDGGRPLEEWLPFTHTGP